MPLILFPAFVPYFSLYIGVAAVNVGGRTLDSVLSGFRRSRRRTVNDAIRSQMLCAHVVIIDEMSMITPRLLGEFEIFCRAVTGKSDLPWGGLNVVIAGDFFQLPPCEDKGSNPLFDTPCAMASSVEMLGREQYLHITNCATVILDTNMRSSDAFYTELQSLNRVGKYPLKVKTAILDRIGQIPTSSSTQPESSIDSHEPILVWRNQTRQEIERLRLAFQSAICGNDTSNLPIAVYAIMQASTRSKWPLTNEERDYISTLPDNETNKIPVVAYLVKDAFMMITSNINTSCGLAQGSVGRLIDWDFPVGTEYKVVAIDDDHNSLVRVPFLNGFITQPTCVYFKLVSHKLIAKPAGQPDNLPEDVVALPLRKITRS